MAPRKSQEAKDETIRKLMVKLRKIAKEHKGECLSDLPEGLNKNVKFRCAEGHEWTAVAGNILSGSWCKKCGYDSQSAKSKKKSLDRFVKYLKAKKIRILDPENYTGYESRLNLICSKGHEWQSTPGIMRAKGECPGCKKDKKHIAKIVILQELAKERGGKCLSKLYYGMKEKHQFQCAKGHVWEAKAFSIKLGTWCPICATKGRPKVDETEKKIRRTSNDEKE
ncbi:MAG: hypothetical protein CSYNP_03980 [Syntrophus sp. SKADARSKE-3]|nr:hypothetical protein [Syntrophus sp. SKADARSKE-3]